MNRRNFLKVAAGIVGIASSARIVKHVFAQDLGNDKLHPDLRRTLQDGTYLRHPDYPNLADVLVLYHSKPTTTDISEITKFGGVVGFIFDIVPGLRAGIPPSKLEEYASLGNVKLIEPNYRIQIPQPIPPSYDKPMPRQPFKPSIKL